MRNFEQLSAIMAGTAIASAIVIVQPYSAMALTGQEVNEIARSVTVLINSDRGGQGSGVIISKNNNTYYVLTANHVVPTGEDREGKIKYRVITPDDQKAYSINFETVKSLASQGVDLAIVEFTSDKDYQVATLANSQQVTQGVPVFVSGWPRPGAMSSATGNQMIRQFTDGRVSTILATPLQGYQIGYTNTTLGGMSGGPVIDAGGRVVAIHGQADVDNVNAEALLQSGEMTEEQREDVQKLAGLIASTGFNYGIAINTFLELTPQLGIYLSMQVEDTPPPELGAPYVPSAQPDRRDTIDDLNDILNNVERGIDTIERLERLRKRLLF
jgi:serine protease Do